MKLTHAEAYRIRMYQQGRCIYCGQSRAGSGFAKLCCRCGIKRRQQQRERNGASEKRQRKGRPAVQCVPMKQRPRPEFNSVIDREKLGIKKTRFREPVFAADRGEER